ncbi:hypothetical protein LU689_11310 [Pseudomonas asiatica]|uniref:hypothetical protein n=1 Tax=Pseudomonas asiatica TaxID=2219225 RepID=UPI001E52FF91|nr:hypothetical protein [Pseudomonas asiatica]MCE0850501.1 hypothetical protein [Pseudomonas asiatica]
MLHDDDDGKSGFVSELIEAGMLEGAAEGIARQWLEKGDESLSEKQRFIFDTYVLNANDPGSCARGCDIPWSEKFQALDSGMCSYCAHVLEKAMRE